MTPASHVRPRTCRAEPSSPRQRPRRHRRKETLAKLSLQVYLCIMSEEITPNGVREIDASALKGLAHPLRMAIYDALTNHGPQTATSLAKRPGVPCGRTRSLLRRLAPRHRTRGVGGEGGRRPEWWEPLPGAVRVPGPERELDPSTRTASHYVNRGLVRNMSRAFEDFVDAAYDEKRIPLEWVEASASDTINLHLTKEQLAEITAEYEMTTI